MDPGHQHEGDEANLHDPGGGHGAHHFLTGGGALHHADENLRPVNLAQDAFQGRVGGPGGVVGAVPHQDQGLAGRESRANPGPGPGAGNPPWTSKAAGRCWCGWAGSGPRRSTGKTRGRRAGARIGPRPIVPLAGQGPEDLVGCRACGFLFVLEAVPHHAGGEGPRRSRPGKAARIRPSIKS